MFCKSKTFYLEQILPGLGEICARSLQDHNQLNAPFPISFPGPLKVCLDIGTTLLSEIPVFFIKINNLSFSKKTFNEAFNSLYNL